MTSNRLTSNLRIVLAILGFAFAIFGSMVTIDAATSHGLSSGVGLDASLMSLPLAGLFVLPGIAGLFVVLLGATAAVREISSHLRVLRTLKSSPSRQMSGSTVTIIEAASPQAFCFGLLRPRVYVTSAAVAELTPEALEAVISHERHHARRRDPLRLAFTRILSSAVAVLPGLRDVATDYAQQVELDADRAALRGPDRHRALASALLVFDSHGQSVHANRIAQLTGRRWRNNSSSRLLASGVMVNTVLITAAFSGAAVLGHLPGLMSVLSCVLAAVQGIV